MGTVPRYNLDLNRFSVDPYPDLKELRSCAPIAFIPQLNATMITKQEDILEVGRRPDIFSSQLPNSLMNRLMGENLMRRDGAEHAYERNIVAPAISPKKVSEVWRSQFQSNADRIIHDLQPRGEADFVTDFALPFCAESLKLMTGLINVRYQDMDAWSQAMMDGISNYQGDPVIEKRCQDATSAIDAALDEMIPRALNEAPNSLLGAMIAAASPIDRIRVNIKLAISGGQNEPRKAIAGTLWALLERSEQLEAVRSGAASWSDAFDEYVRWMSPISMIPRQVASPVTLRGVDLAAGDRVLLMLASGNRDEEKIPFADRYDVKRDKVRSLSFGTGPHFCAGAWAARCMASDVALPSVLHRLANISVARDKKIQISGWVFRGLVNLPLRWTPN